MGKQIWSVFRQPGKTQEQTQEACRKTIEQRAEFKLEFMLASSGNGMRVTASFRPAAKEALSSDMPLIGIPGFVPWQVKGSIARPWCESGCQPAAHAAQPAL